MYTEDRSIWEGKEVLENLARIYEQIYLVPGEEGEKLYPDIVRRGKHAPCKSLGHFHGSKEDSCRFVETPAGEVRVVTLHDRSDFETFLQIMSKRCRKTPIPGTQGAVILDGVINHRKIERHKEEFYLDAASRGMPEPSSLAWSLERARFIKERANYTDALIVLSTGAYSALSAKRAGFSQEEWLGLSFKIREYHECTHFMCRRFYREKIDVIYDEVVADAVGILAALGRYDIDLAKRVLGIEGDSYVGGRLENYVPLEEKGKERAKVIEEILPKVFCVMEAISKEAEGKEENPFLLACALEEQKEILWDT